MAADKPQPTLADYVAIALSPVLIMALVGSLVFFLLEVLYVGKYEGRLQWILFFFVFAAVLIARISMTAGISERAPLYGLILAVLVWIGLWRFVEFPPATPLAEYSWAINLGLLALIWWCTHRLTWDCTFIDENVDASGKGLLEVAGLEGSQEPVAEVDTAEADHAEVAGKAATGLSGWLERYRQYRDQCRRRPHAPGVWVVYFSLAALPLFGLGQALIPAGDLARRRYVFWLMGLYVGSGLGLLLTTSFLGLRRYLRQRKLQMPQAMTAVWLATGGAMIVALLLVGAFLPRPNAEYPLVHLSWLPGSKDREASRWAVGGGQPGTGEGRPGSQGSQDGQAGSSGSGSGSGQAGGQNQGSATSGQGQSQGGSGGGSSSGNSGSSQGQNASGQGGSGSQPGQNGSGNGQGSSGQGSSSGRSGNGDSANQSGANARDGSGGQAAVKPGEHASNADRDADHGSDSPSGSESSFSFRSTLSGLATLLKWVVFALVALVVAFYVLRAVLKFLANFTNWARNLLAALQGLFSGWGRGTAPAAAEVPAERRRPPPFASYVNPFAGGGRSSHSPEELVRYSFEALEAWAWEHGLARQADDTPLEFAERIGEDVPALEADARRLAALYARAAYARGRLPASCIDLIRQFWQQLGAANAPLSAR
jgi:uncharacterized protein DUF4129